MQPSRSAYATGLMSLVLLMAVTRPDHFGSAISLPDASLAVFFIAGFYLRSPLVFVVLMVEGVLIDYAAITHAGVSDWCVSPAYVFLIPTYASLWFAGLWYGARHQNAWRTLLPLGVALAIGILTAFLISNGSFYLFSGRFPDTGWLEYGVRVAQYLPPYVTGTLIYVLFAAALHGVVTAVNIRHAASRQS